MDLWPSKRKWPIAIFAVLALAAVFFEFSPVLLCSPTRQAVVLRLGSKTSTVGSRNNGAREKFPVEILEHGLQGRLHQEPAYATWNECIILVSPRVGERVMAVVPQTFAVGGVNLTRAQGADVLRTGPITRFAKEGIWGSRQVTVFNMTDRSVRSGPDAPIRNNHAMGAMSPEGRMHALVSEAYLLRSENASENAGMHHYVWDFAGGGTSWEERTPLSNITGAGRCEFVHNLLYCFGGSLAAGTPAVNTLTIYDPQTDTWTRGAPMPEELDHSASVVYDNRIWSSSGRYHVDHKPGTAEASPKAPSSAANLVYNPSTDSWTRVEPLPYRRNAGVATVLRRPGKRATLLTAGGQIFAGIRAGLIFSMLEEYDFEEDDWFCHATHLPQAVFGAAVGIFDNKVYIVGGADGYHISGTDSVMIIDIEALGEPMPCMYDETSRPDWWTDYRAGNMANYPYARHFLRDEPAPLTPL